MFNLRKYNINGFKFKSAGELTDHLWTFIPGDTRPSASEKEPALSKADAIKALQKFWMLLNKEEQNKEKNFNLIMNNPELKEAFLGRPGKPGALKYVLSQCQKHEHGFDDAQQTLLNDIRSFYDSLLSGRIALTLDDGKLSATINGGDTMTVYKGNIRPNAVITLNGERFVRESQRAVTVNDTPDVAPAAASASEETPSRLWTQVTTAEMQPTTPGVAPGGRR